MKQIQDLVEISRYYGNDNSYVIAGGGNTSYKGEDKIWIKASGTPLATITEEGFAILDRKKLEVLSHTEYSSNTEEREEQVKNVLEAAAITRNKRPSVETPIHTIIRHSFVVHLHPTLVSGLMCANNAEAKVYSMFGDKVLYVPYTDPGYVLFKKVADSIEAYRAKHHAEPQVIWLQNHGIFVAAETIEEIRKIYADILEEIDTALQKKLPVSKVESIGAEAIVPALRMMVSKDEMKILKVRNNALIQHFTQSAEAFSKVSRPFTPDTIVYCKSNYLYFSEDNPDELLKAAPSKIQSFEKEFGYSPKIIVIKNLGLIAVGDHAQQCDLMLDVFEDSIKIAYLSESFGGPHPLNEAQIAFIDTWEVENYRRSVAAKATEGRLKNKVIIVTGAAQGFGEGIAKNLMNEGANIIVADLNETIGAKTAENFNSFSKSSKALFVKTDVSDITSIENALKETILHFGGVDCFISNAGVLRAGGLDEMTPETFDFVTKINYNAFFYCTKAVSRIMKLQTKYASADYYADIIQINSKSGLRGSKANFAYAGGKFGGIGLVQSFALELAPNRIKVNAICPGNYYEGPLWSDPDNGLFVQYLNAGKVPGAKTVEDVKEFYLAQVPMRKGCTPEDVSKGAMYLMDQAGETGQALPITGGQVMLS